ncbi:Transcription factor yanR [Ceratocystis fimbriata CBS 114723]|uniref:Transcription factor yanR n=1 Tax=Ceratocystis fimbriata CBS 114723 TaxID=1035309 RepID=A0A2C5X086_9PEZI|nr:Transcription factor yanR [Ceratocystis fimbriata CBS 114723]
MQDRIDRLEGLVLSLMHSGAHIDTLPSPPFRDTQRPSSHDGESISSSPIPRPGFIEENNEYRHLTGSKNGSSPGLLKVDIRGGRSMYVGQQHWYTILSDISEIKAYCVAHKREFERGYAAVMASKPAFFRDGPLLLRGAAPAPPEELRSSLPPKEQVMKLVDNYLASIDGTQTMIHKPTFTAQLQKHWESPEETSLTFIGLIYAIMSLSLINYSQAKNEPVEFKGRAIDLATQFRRRTIQCLHATDYTSPGEYTIETLLLYMLSELLTRWEADIDLYLIMGTIVRLAFRMGYHRDSKWFPSLSPFKAEMRRRVWAFVQMTDVLISLQVSLPSMIDNEECDTQFPTNLRDEDFGPETRVLPPPRPWTDDTSIDFMIFKSMLYSELTDIVKCTTRINKKVTYEQILCFDERLDQIYRQIPDQLRVCPPNPNDPTVSFMRRYNLEITYQKIRCFLHREFAAKARQNPRFNHSRTVAVEAALASLGHLATLHKATLASPHLVQIKWYVQASATKDFMLPAILVSVDLHHDRETKESSRNVNSSATSGFWTKRQRQNMLRVLEFTRKIWTDCADHSIDAFKSSHVLTVLLRSIQVKSCGSESESRAKSYPGSGREDDHVHTPSTVHSENTDHSRLSSLAPDSRMTTSAPTPSIESVKVPPHPGSAMEYAARHSNGQTSENCPPPNVAAPVYGAIPELGAPNIQAEFLNNQINMDQYNMNISSPFAYMLNNMSTQGAMNNIDWDVFDNFTQSNAAMSIEPSFSMYAVAPPPPPHSQRNEARNMEPHNNPHHQNRQLH